MSPNSDDSRDLLTRLRELRDAAVGRERVTLVEAVSILEMHSDCAPQSGQAPQAPTAWYRVNECGGSASIEFFTTKEEADKYGGEPLYKAAPQSGGKDADARDALRFLLSRIGGWTNGRWDQHLRYEFGDERANRMVAALAAMQSKTGEGGK